MALQYVGGQVAGRTNPSSGVAVNYALTGGLASTPSIGDFVIVTCVTGSAAGNPAMTVTAPGTWSNIGLLNQSAQTADTSLDVSYKFLASGETTSLTIPGTTNNAWAEAYAIQVWRGADPTTPLNVTPVSAGGTGTGRPDPASITPTASGSVVIICGGGAAATGADYVAPTNFTTNFLTATGADTTDAMVGMGYWTGWSSGAVNPAAYTGGTTGATDSWASYTLVLQPVQVVTHSCTGAMTAGTGALAGTASSATTRSSTGALTGGGAALAGTASSATTRPSTGALTGPGAALAGTAARTGVTAALTGTITASVTEADIVAGGKTIILTLTGDTWIP
jgi:hypothetical protein